MALPTPALPPGGTPPRPWAAGSRYRVRGGAAGGRSRLVFAEGHRSRHVLVAIILLGAVLCSPFAVPAGESDTLYTKRQRFGVSVARSFTGIPDFPGHPTSFFGVEDLGFGWWSDWSWDLSPWTTDDIEFAQVISGKPRPKLEEAVRANPGSLWIIGNEPETRGQGEFYPWEYAEMYHDLYYFVKGLDPESRVAIGGVVMPSPLRLKWLDICLDHYAITYGEPMPVDVWNIHVQILQERRDDWGCGIPFGLDDQEGLLYEIIDNCDPYIFKQLVRDFRRWMYARGEGDRPLIISEYGVLMPSSYLPRGDRSVLDFMEITFDFMLSERDPVIGYAADGGRLVQRWMWFSLNFPFYDVMPGGFNGALYYWEDPAELTIFGEFFADYVQREEMSHVYVPYVLGHPRDLAPPSVASRGGAAEDTPEATNSPSSPSPSVSPSPSRSVTRVERVGAPSPCLGRIPCAPPTPTAEGARR